MRNISWRNKLNFMDLDIWIGYILGIDDRFRVQDPGFKSGYLDQEITGVDGITIPGYRQVLKTSVNKISEWENFMGLGLL